MPDDYYVSKYSGEEIDERLTAAHNAVRYDAAQSLTDAQKTQARGNINAAPGGFGLGGAIVYAPENSDGASDANLINATGFYLAIANTEGGWNYVFHMQYPSNAALQFSSYVNNTTYRIRKKINGVWQPWEWVNPPMLLGVEYRTTERYLGKPVYAKCIHCESMPSGAGYIDIQPSDTEVSNALISTAIVIRCYGRASVEATIPFYSGSGDFMQVGVVENCKIRIYTAKAYGGTADITVHYVKSTD